MPFPAAVEATRIPFPAADLVLVLALVLVPPDAAVLAFVLVPPDAAVRLLVREAVRTVLAVRAVFPEEVLVFVREAPDTAVLVFVLVPPVAAVRLLVRTLPDAALLAFVFALPLPAAEVRPLVRLLPAAAVRPPVREAVRAALAVRAVFPEEVRVFVRALPAALFLPERVREDPAFPVLLLLPAAELVRAFALFFA